MRYRKMTDKQLLVYGARIRLGWFRKAEELGNASAACCQFWRVQSTGSRFVFDDMGATTTILCRPCGSLITITGLVLLLSDSMNGN